MSGSEGVNRRTEAESVRVKRRTVAGSEGLHRRNESVSVRVKGRRQEKKVDKK